MIRVIVIFSALLISLGLKAQITLEKTYDQHMQLVSFPGEAVPKYYTLNAQQSKAQFYNIDHSPFKTFNIPNVNGILQGFNYLSTNTFDKDEGKEYLIAYKDTTDDHHYVRVYDDDQTSMLNTKGHYGLVEKTDTGKLVLMVYHQKGDTTQTKIFELGGENLPVDYERPSPSFDIFPNPASSKLNISFGSNQAGGTAIFTLFSSTGRQVMHQRISNRNAPTMLNIDHLESGVYVTRLEFSNGRINAKKVVIVD